MLEPFEVLFYTNGSPIEAQSMKRLVSEFGESYKKTVKKIITNSATLSKDTFRLNVATLLPSFGMTRRGAFHGLKIVGAAIRDPNHILDICWAQVGSELPALKKIITENSFDQRSRAMLELSPDSRNRIIEKVSELFEKLKWTSAGGSYVGRVGASKILFAVLPEICLPVDNAEWDYVFRTDDYHRVLSTMIDEINEWEAKAHTRFESLDSPPTTLPSVYNVMAMAARANAHTSLNYPRHSGSTDKNADALERSDEEIGWEDSLGPDDSHFWGSPLETQVKKQPAKREERPKATKPTLRKRIRKFFGL